MQHTWKQVSPPLLPSLSLFFPFSLPVLALQKQATVPPKSDPQTWVFPTPPSPHFCSAPRPPPRGRHWVQQVKVRCVLGDMHEYCLVAFTIKVQGQNHKKEALVNLRLTYPLILGTNWPAFQTLRGLCSVLYGILRMSAGESAGHLSLQCCGGTLQNYFPSCPRNDQGRWFGLVLCEL